MQIIFRFIHLVDRVRVQVGKNVCCYEGPKFCYFVDHSGSWLHFFLADVIFLCARQQPRTSRAKSDSIYLGICEFSCADVRH